MHDSFLMVLVAVVLEAVSKEIILTIVADTASDWLREQAKEWLPKFLAKLVSIWVRR